MEDGMRHHLVTKFYCSKCGQRLSLSHGKLPHVVGFGNNPDPSDDITGAAKIEHNVGIHPCQNCYSAALAPLKALRAALAVDIPK